VSGKGTSWGYWDPGSLNGVPGKPNERGGNSLQALAFMASASRVCDNATSHRFGDAVVSLVRDHGYDYNAINAMATSPQSLAFFDFRYWLSLSLPPLCLPYSTNTFDFRLAFMSYFILASSVPGLVVPGPSPPGDSCIPLTPDEAQLFHSRIKLSVTRYWNQQGATVDGLNNRVGALESVFRLITGNNNSGIVDAEETLRRYPDDMVDWPSTNSHRLDVRLRPDWRACPGGNSGFVAETVLPADEALNHGSSDFMTEAAANSVDGGTGRQEMAPNPWLLVYWMRRYLAL
jgi:hypothetical protein